MAYNNVMTMKPRHSKLLATIEEHREVKLSGLVKTTGASEATIRRDLQELEEAGHIVRTFGGAKIAPSQSLVGQAFGRRTLLMRREKQAIAKAAADLVQPGMMVALDAGTTAWHVAQQLKSKAPLTVITCALAPLEELGNVPGITIFLVGGRYLPKDLSFMSAETVNSLQRFHADISFVGFEALQHGRGVFSTSRDGAGVGAAMAGCGNRRVLVGDSSKFGASAPFIIVQPNQIDTVITDDGVDADSRRHLAQEPYRVIYASAEKEKLPSE